MLLSRETIEKVGRFDGEYELEYYEDLDYSLRVKKIGLRRSLIDATPDIYSLASKNREVFRRKWDSLAEEPEY